eukprot:NODE_2408_length_1207_cov_5.078584_g2195_i0.p2 GENE.NODE_2408_length_1207_cov_5.078584_g2195_i0~~NODE_2408_length_1207_cov_5.078584_g2195_i0.p2  ORF type:complete len:192 (+),score=11.04 NODE_2408_length_1207_cov_5.078584_g2195_i0:568-1143(+)
MTLICTVSRCNNSTSGTDEIAAEWIGRLGSTEEEEEEEENMTKRAPFLLQVAKKIADIIIMHELLINSPRTRTRTHCMQQHWTTRNLHTVAPATPSKPPVIAPTYQHTIRHSLFHSICSVGFISLHHPSTLCTVRTKFFLQKREFANLLYPFPAHPSHPIPCHLSPQSTSHPLYCLSTADPNAMCTELYFS